MDPRLAAAFAELRAASGELAGPDAVANARGAMYRAVAERHEPRGLLLVMHRTRRGLALHRVFAGLAGAAMALSAVTALGWNSPAGAPLHLVQLAHEQISLALPGTDRAAADLGYAEARLDQAARGESESEALSEAQRLLDDAHDYLPADHTSALWARWQADSGRLVALRTGFEHEAQKAEQTPPPGGSTAGGPAQGNRQSTTTTTRGGASSEDGHGKAAPDGHESRSTTGTASPEAEGHSSQSSSTTTTSGHGGSPEPSSTPEAEHAGH
jgi:hypothetical protein